MRISTPKSRQDLHIKKRYRVLEIGPGNNPSFRADVLADKFLGDDSHRSGGLRIYPHQKLVNAAAEALPFADKEFDYVICNQVLEHSDDPAQFLREVMRVGKAGYIETPSLLGEWLFPKQSHRYVVLCIGDKLVLYDKQRVPGNYANDYGELFLNYLPYQSLPYKLLPFSEGELMHVRYEWKDDIDFGKPDGRILQQILPEEMGPPNGLHALSAARIRHRTGTYATGRSTRHRRQTAPVAGTPSHHARRVQKAPSGRTQVASSARALQFIIASPAKTSGNFGCFSYICACNPKSQLPMKH